jgi:uncharacterized membrane protein
MATGRLEAFSDAVIAILITIMILELRAPHGTDWHALAPLVAPLLSYILSFIYLGIYWNNHHHMLHSSDRVNGAILWANLHLLFWLSLVPFATSWMGENHLAPLPTASYGVVLLMSAIAWVILQTTILREHGPDSKIARALGSDVKGKVSLALYVTAIALAFVRVSLAHALYAVVALMWLVPDRRFVSVVQEEK